MTDLPLPRRPPDLSRTAPQPRPVIGIPAALEEVGAENGPADAAFVTRPYLRHVVRAGGTPMILLPEPELASEVDEVLDRVDGVLLAGGIDIDPAHYGATRHRCTEATVPDRDVFELALVHAAWRRATPVLGICRGMQLMNVALGGTLHQHLPDVVGHDRHHADRQGHVAGADRHVRLAESSLAARAAGVQLLSTASSRHHQGVRTIAAPLRSSGWTADDLPVALEAPGAPFFLGVQWHPEADEDSQVIATLVSAARRSWEQSR